MKLILITYFDSTHSKTLSWKHILFIKLLIRYSTFFNWIFVTFHVYFTHNASKFRLATFQVLLRVWGVWELAGAWVSVLMSGRLPFWFLILPISVFGKVGGTGIWSIWVKTLTNGVTLVKLFNFCLSSVLLPVKLS